MKKADMGDIVPFATDEWILVLSRDSKYDTIEAKVFATKDEALAWKAIQMGDQSVRVVLDRPPSRTDKGDK